jgi:hypothetical protein
MFNPYLFISKSLLETFKLVEMQTDNTFILAILKFSAIEEKEI